MRKKVAMLAFFSCLAPIGVAAADRISTLEYDEQQSSKFGFTHNDVTRFLAYGKQFPSCSEVARAFPDFNSIPNDVPAVTHIIHQHAACRAALQSEKAPVGVFRVEDSLRGLACVIVSMMAPDTDASNDPDCNLPSSLPAPAH